MEIIRRKDAIERGLDRYFTGKPCKRGHLCFRYVSSNGCSQCVKDHHSVWRVKNKDKMAAKEKRWRENNSQKIKKLREKWAANNPEKNKQVLEAARKKWRINNKDKIAKARKDWFARNEGYRAAAAAKRRAREQKAMLNTISTQDFKAIYLECSKISRRTGVQHNVDHIVPLQGQNVCGLHVPWNLQVITAEQNVSKSNKWETA